MPVTIRIVKYDRDLWAGTNRILRDSVGVVDGWESVISRDERPEDLGMWEAGRRSASQRQWTANLRPIPSHRLHWERFQDCTHHHQQSQLPPAQRNSASYAQRDGNWVVVCMVRDEGLMWLIVAVVCLLAATLHHATFTTASVSLHCTAQLTSRTQYLDEWTSRICTKSNQIKYGFLKRIYNVSNPLKWC